MVYSLCLTVIVSNYNLTLSIQYVNELFSLVSLRLSAKAGANIKPFFLSHNAFWKKN